VDIAFADAWLIPRWRRAPQARTLEKGTVMSISNEGIVVILIVGLVAGWLAGQVVRGSGFGLIGDIIIGILGAFIGAWLLPQLNVRIGVGLVNAIASATIGAVVLLVLLRAVRGGRRW
jgi:uncharacterized membrane protein YeaQ/YmgE (transglycosylase-associated protein family)